MKVAVYFRSIRHETDRAYLIRVTKTREVWLPKTAVSLRCRNGSKSIAIMSQVLADQKALGYRPLRHVPVPLVAERRDVLAELRYE